MNRFLKTFLNLFRRNDLLPEEDSIVTVYSIFMALITSFFILILFIMTKGLILIPVVGLPFLYLSYKMYKMVVKYMDPPPTTSQSKKGFFKTLKNFLNDRNKNEHEAFICCITVLSTAAICLFGVVVLSVITKGLFLVLFFLFLGFLAFREMYKIVKERMDNES